MDVEINEQDLIKFISEKLNVDPKIVEAVLDAEFEYLEESGVVSYVEDSIK